MDLRGQLRLSAWWPRRNWWQDSKPHRESLLPRRFCARNFLGRCYRHQRPAPTLAVTNVVSSSRSTPVDQRQSTAVSLSPSAITLASLGEQTKRHPAPETSTFSLLHPKQSCRKSRCCGLSPAKHIYGAPNRLKPATKGPYQPCRGSRAACPLCWNALLFIATSRSVSVMASTWSCKPLSL